MDIQSLNELAIPEDKRLYITDVLNPVLEEVVVELLKELPGDPGSYIMKWFMRRYNVSEAREEFSENERVSQLCEENERLKLELKQMKNNVKHATEMVADMHGRTSNETAEASSEEDDDDEIPDWEDMPEVEETNVTLEKFG